MTSGGGGTTLTTTGLLDLPPAEATIDAVPSLSARTVTDPALGVTSCATVASLVFQVTGWAVVTAPLASRTVATSRCSSDTFMPNDVGATVMVETVTPIVTVPKSTAWP